MASNPLLSPAVFANTYASGWESVRRYQQWQTWREEHPEEGPTQAATELDVPVSDIKRWADGERPHPIRGLEAARARGWINVSPDSETARALIRLLAWVDSWGSLTNPRSGHLWLHFSARTLADEDRLAHWCERAGVSLTIGRDQEEGKLSQLKPADEPALLARALIGLGLSPGKAADRQHLPSAVREPQSSRYPNEYAATYLRNRGLLDSQGTFGFHLSRPESYLGELVDIFENGANLSVVRKGSLLQLDGDEVRRFLTNIDDLGVHIE